MADFGPDDLPFVPPAEVALVEPNTGKPKTAFHDWLTALWEKMKGALVDLTTKITTVTDQVGDISAEVEVLQIAQADLEGAFASYQVTVTAQFGAVNAAITSESTARANADSAMATQITSLTATVGSNTAAISAEATTRANADTAISATITSLTATVNGNTAAISTEATTRATADSALSTSITSVSAVANSATANVQIFWAAKAAPAGASAAFGAYLTAGSSFAGFEMLALSGGGSAIGLTANQFYFTDGGTAQQVLSYSGGLFTFTVPVAFVSTSGSANGTIKAEGLFFYDPSSNSSIEIGFF